jgi:hypothetical protein
MTAHLSALPLNLLLSFSAFTVSLLKSAFITAVFLSPVFRPKELPSALLIRAYLPRSFAVNLKSNQAIQGIPKGPVFDTSVWAILIDLDDFPNALSKIGIEKMEDSLFFQFPGKLQDP